MLPPRLATGVMLSFALAAFSSGCWLHPAPQEPRPLADYTKFLETRRIIDPAGFIAFLRSTRYPNGELDNLPPYAIILHDSRVEEFLTRAGYSSDDYQVRPLGQTDPNVLHVVRAKDGRPGFILNGGLPGAGGIATQSAELSALGVEYVVHIGTAGIVANGAGPDTLIIGTASYKDGAAFLLSENGPGRTVDPLAHADSGWTRLLGEALASMGVPYVRRIGFTVPVLYFQPSGLMLALIRGSEYSAARPAFVEMEEAAVFEVARRTGMKAASLVAGTDRYTIQSDTLVHEFLDYDADALKAKAVQAAIRAFMRLNAQAKR